MTTPRRYESFIQSYALPRLSPEQTKLWYKYFDPSSSEYDYATTEKLYFDHVDGLLEGDLEAVSLIEDEAYDAAVKALNYKSRRTEYMQEAFEILVQRDTPKEVLFELFAPVFCGDEPERFFPLLFAGRAYKNGMSQTDIAPYIGYKNRETVSRTFADMKQRGFNAGWFEGSRGKV